MALETQAVDKRAEVRKAKAPREIGSEVRRHKRDLPKTADYELGLDDFSGCSLEHTHNDLGHCWPMTREELMTLLYDIMDLLDVDTSGWHS